MQHVADVEMGWAAFATGAAEHRDLHSFPTRRSSDLALARREDRRLVEEVGELRAREAGGAARDVGEVDALHLDRPRVDRKSTRLNSSHMSTSYAGFCLHKKSSSCDSPRAT